jgi:magnesium transporter
MIDILRPSKSGLEALDDYEKDCWVHASTPSKEEIDEICTFLKVPNELILSLQDIDEIPIIEKQDGLTFIIIRIPRRNSDADEYSTVPLGIIMTEDTVLTFCFFENDIIGKLKNQKFTFNKIHLVLRLLLVSSRTYLNYLKEINKKIYIVESSLERSQKNAEIMKLLDIQKSLVYFSTSLKSDQLLIEKLAKNEHIIMSVEDKELIEEVNDENKQAIEMTNIYSNILSSTMSAFASIISNNLNMVVKLLTSITIILSLPILVASVYGMNIELPFQHSTNAFGIVIAFSVGIAITGVILLWKNKLL